MSFEKPVTRFTRAGEVAIAWQVVGDGPVDLIYIAGWLSNIDVVWEHPGYRRFLEGLAEKCRVILLDKRGTGMSDRNVGAPTLEERAEDIRAVMAAAGSTRAALFGISEGGSMTAMFAACYPEMVRSIVMIGSFPCRAWKPDWSYGERRAEFEDDLARLERSWGDLGYLLSWAAPSVQDDPAERAFFNRLLTQSASPGSAVAISRLNYEIDLRAILPAIKVPALVLHPEKDVSVSVEEARYIADAIPGARFEFVANSDHLPWIGDTGPIVRQITDFVCDTPEPAREDRVLATILMTDIADSTGTTARMGDARWRAVIEPHDSAAARAVARHDGTLVKTLGDGILATFSGPSRAVSCAAAIQAEAVGMGLTVRAGIHAGECLRRKGDVTGMAVNIAARILDLAPGGEGWVSGTVRDLVVGSGLRFEPMGARALKGVPDDWPLYRVVA
jgi:pimeloyl-ACP methyl ester carboxylesterase